MLVRHPSSYLLLPAILDGVVAFTAKLAVADSYPTHTGILKFANISVNKARAYNNDSGIFTCPRKGYYHFMVHMSVYGRGQCAIRKNGEIVATLYDTSLPNKCIQVSTVSCVVELEKNDNVWVCTYGPGRNDFFATAENDSIFVGFRLG